MVMDVEITHASSDDLQIPFVPALLPERPGMSAPLPPLVPGDPLRRLCRRCPACWAPKLPRRRFSDCDVVSAFPAAFTPYVFVNVVSSSLAGSCVYGALLKGTFSLSTLGP